MTKDRIGDHYRIEREDECIDDPNPMAAIPSLVRPSLAGGSAQRARRSCGRVGCPVAEHVPSLLACAPVSRSV
jgi:hypothetical protein